MAFTGPPRLVAGKTISGQAGEMSFDLSYEPAGRGHHVELKLHPKGDLSGTIDIDVNIKSLAHSGTATIAGQGVRHRPQGDRGQTLELPGSPGRALQQGALTPARRPGVGDAAGC